ncbi:MAG: J domain-containing protein [Clostridia bacterium]|nr:J domain-containing protein [Clostridia bacterium]
MNDPYQVLGVSPSASDDEVKAAYRRLAKQYHPDRNNGSAEAERRMMQINDAYAQIVDMRKNGGAAQSGYGGYGGYGYGGYGGYGGSGQAQQRAPEFESVRRQLDYRDFQGAMETLERMNTQSAEWYYLVARARQGLGDDIAALNFARQAVNMEPNNMEYLSFLQQMSMSGQEYRQRGVSYGGIQNFLCQNPCLTCLLFNLCCGGGCGTRIWCC